MQFKKCIVLTCCITSMYALAPGTAWSMEGEERSTATMPDVTVIANKIEESIYDVPQSITVIDEVILEEKGITSIPQIIEDIPNMNVSSSNTFGTPVNFRGINPSMFTNNNPVVLYIDGVPASDRYNYSASFANVERVEVLRGPQGTLYGKDAIGGVINIVTKTPTDEWNGKVGAEYGSNNYMQGVFNANGPLVDHTFFLSLNGQFEKDDGWIDNIYPGMDSDANRTEAQRLSASVLYTPTEVFTVRLTLTLNSMAGSWLNGYALSGGADISDFNRDDAEEVSIDTDTETEQESFSQSLQLSYEFESMTLTSTTTHENSDQDGVYDPEYSDDSIYAGLIQFNSTEVENYTQELRLSSNNETGIRWVGGFYFEYEDREQGPYGSQFPAYNSVYEYLGAYEMNSESDTESTTYAVFGQVMVPFMECFELTLGGRYQYIKKDYVQDLYYLPVGMSGPAMFSLDPRQDWNVFLPRLALTYILNDNWNTYISYSHGYMPGGFNHAASSGTAKDNTFEPQQSKSYEIGIKGCLDRLRVAAALFYMDIEDIHVYKSFGTSYYTDNADSAHTMGAELELAYRLTDSIELTGAFGIIEAEYDTYDAGDGISFDGETIQNTPSYTMTAGVSYIHPQGFYSRADIKAMGEISFYDDYHKAIVDGDAYITLDARVGCRINDWDCYVYGRNLTDEEYITNFNSNTSTSLAEFGDPITVGIGVRYTF